MIADRCEGLQLVWDRILFPPPPLFFFFLLFGTAPLPLVVSSPSSPPPCGTTGTDNNKVKQCLPMYIHPSPIYFLSVHRTGSYQPCRSRLRTAVCLCHPRWASRCHPAISVSSGWVCRLTGRGFFIFLVGGAQLVALLASAVTRLASSWYRSSPVGKTRVCFARRRWAGFRFLLRLCMDYQSRCSHTQSLLCQVVVTSSVLLFVCMYVLYLVE